MLEVESTSSPCTGYPHSSRFSLLESIDMPCGRRSRNAHSPTAGGDQRRTCMSLYNTPPDGAFVFLLPGVLVLMSGKKRITLSVVAAQETYLKIMAHFAALSRSDVETRHNNTAMRVSAILRNAFLRHKANRIFLPAEEAGNRQQKSTDDPSLGRPHHV